MSRAHFILATAGHVDHGKSALIKALTGTDPDRLPEEKARGITIDLGFAHLELPNPQAAGASFQVGIVDVPGHEDFVKNMVSGVSSLDAALLVVAADDGWMPQTEEHVQILAYLGLSRGVVALTKFDLAQDGEAAVAAVRERLLGTWLADAPIVPTSVVSGQGLDELKNTLARVLSDAPLPRDIAKPRLPVDRAFTLPGIGTIVTGTLMGGVFRRGQAVVVQPSGKTVRIRSLQSHGRDVDTGIPGTRTAMNLTDLRVPEDIHRGDVVTLDTLGGPTEVLDVRLEISPRATRSLKHGVRVHVHYGSGSVAARVALYSGDKLDVGEQTLAQLRLEAAAFVFAGDRVTLRDWSEQHTLAGAIVLDPDANNHGFRSPARRRCLERRAKAPDDVMEFIGAEVERDGVVLRARLAVKSRFSAGEVAEAEARLAAAGMVLGVGDFIVDAVRWQALRRRAADAIDAAHQAHAEQAGLSLTELRTLLSADLPGDQIEALIDDLCSGDFARVGTAIRRAAHRPGLPADLQAAGAALRSVLADQPFDPPSRKDLTPDAASARALRFLIESGEAVEVNSEVVVAAEHFKRAADMVRTFIREHGPATTSELRQVLGGSRRVVVPLLERLDRDGVTFRSGQTRTLR